MTVKFPNPMLRYREILNVLAIDPGTDHSAVVGFNPDGPKILIPQFFENHELTNALRENVGIYHCLAVEMIASYGMPVGREVFETCVWIGRFVEAWHGPFARIYRRDVKLNLCGTPRAKDANIRQALIDRFGGPGTKKNPGMTYGLRKDLWSALGVAVTYCDMRGRGEIRDEASAAEVDRCR